MSALAEYIAKYAGERGGKGKQKTELQASILRAD